MSLPAQTPHVRRPRRAPAPRPRPNAEAKASLVRLTSPAERSVRPRRPKPMDKGPSAQGFAAAMDREAWADLDEPIGTAFFDSLSKIGAYAVDHGASSSSELAPDARGYRSEELAVVAHMASAYLLSGGYRLAEALFEGLICVAPNEAYHWIGLGLLHDRLDRIDAAMSCYRRAAELAPNDPRPRLNQAELMLEQGEKKQALRMLEEAERLARAACELGLAGKAAFLCGRIRAAQGRTS